MENTETPQENPTENTNGSSTQPTETLLNPLVQGLNKVFGVQFTIASNINFDYLRSRPNEVFYGNEKVGATRKLDDSNILISGTIEIPEQSFDPEAASTIGEVISALREGNSLSLKNLPVAAITETVMALSQWNATVSIEGQGFKHKIKAQAFSSIQARQKGLENESLSITPMYALSWRVIGNNISDSDREWLKALNS